MKAKTTISTTEARKRIFEITDAVQSPNVRYTLTNNGKPKAVIMSAEEFESWQETMDILRWHPDILKDIEEVERDIKSGKIKNDIDLEGLDEHFNLKRRAQKTKHKSHAVSRKVQTRRRKES